MVIINITIFILELHAYNKISIFNVQNFSDTKVQKKDRLLAITLNGTHAVRLAITFKGTDACKVLELLFQHIYIEEHISGIQEREFQEGKKLGYFQKVWRYFKKKLFNEF